MGTGERGNSRSRVFKHNFAGHNSPVMIHPKSQNSEGILQSFWLLMIAHISGGWHFVCKIISCATLYDYFVTIGKSLQVIHGQRTVIRPSFDSTRNGKSASFSHGVVAMDETKRANPNRQIVFQKLESTTW